MKVFNASYSWSKRGSFEEEEYIVVAVSELQAHDLINEHHPHTDGTWTFEEISTDNADIHFISSRSN